MSVKKDREERAGVSSLLGLRWDEMGSAKGGEEKRLVTGMIGEWHVNGNERYPLAVMVASDT